MLVAGFSKLDFRFFQRYSLIIAVIGERYFFHAFVIAIKYEKEKKKEKGWLVYKIGFAIWRMVLLDARKEKEKVKLQSCYLHNVKR